MRHQAQARDLGAHRRRRVDRESTETVAEVRSILPGPASACGPDGARAGRRSDAGPRIRRQRPRRPECDARPPARNSARAG